MIREIGYSRIIRASALAMQKEDIHRRSVTSIERRSEREFDIGLGGNYTNPEFSRGGWSAYLPLLAIRELTDWSCEPIAYSTDHPTMVLDGDWSGIRDSSPETINSILELFVLP